MKFTIHIMAVVLITILVSAYTPVTIEAIDDPPLQTHDGDITGDGFREQIEMKGSLLSNQSSFYQDIWVDIQSVFKKKWSISLQSGYDPQISLIDLNHDHTFDLFYQVKKDSEKEKYDYQLYTLKSGNTKKIPLPERLYAKGEFTDGFQVKIQLDPQKEPETLDLLQKKANYIQHSIYDEEGILQKKTSIQFEPISKLEPIVISNSKGYGLKSMQKIKGINKDDDIGTLKTLWHFHNNKWIILNSEIDI